LVKKRLKGGKTCSIFCSDLTVDKLRLQCKDGKMQLFGGKITVLCENRMRNVQTGGKNAGFVLLKQAVEVEAPGTVPLTHSLTHHRKVCTLGSFTLY